jgi:hypothetical protein
MELKSLQNSPLVALKVEARTPSDKTNESEPNRIDPAVVADIRTKAAEVPSPYSSINSLINLGHIAADSINEATGLMQSFIKHVNSGNFDEAYKALPEVGSALTDIASRTTPEGFSPLSGQEFTINQQPPRTLRFPTDVQDAFGLTRTPPPDEYDLAVLQEKFDAFRNESKVVLTAIYKGATSADIAAQNLQASFARPNDVDQATSLANATGRAITARPAEALGASGGDFANSVRLIE